MTDLNILLLTLHKPDDFAFVDWLGEHAKNSRISLILDKDSVTDDVVGRFSVLSHFEFVRCYPNYLNNGNVYLDVEGLHSGRSFTHVLAFGEDDILRAARLRALWGLPGQNIDNAWGFRDKVITKQRLRDAGVSTHECVAIEQPLTLIEFITQHGYPVYVKPRTSSGSVFGKKISDEQGLSEYLENGFTPRIPYSEFASDLCVEPFQLGDLYHIDGIRLDGEIWTCPSKYLTTGLQIHAFSASEVVGSYMLAADNALYARINGYVEAACHILNLPHGHTFHAEVFVANDGDISLCEIACRTGGGKINSTIKAAGGADLNKTQFLAQLGLLERDYSRYLPSPRKLCGWILIPPQEGICEAVPDLAVLPGFCDGYIAMRPGDKGWARSFSGDSMGFVIISGETEMELRKNMEVAARKVVEGMQFRKLA